MVARAGGRVLGLAAEVNAGAPGFGLSGLLEMANRDKEKIRLRQTTNFEGRNPALIPTINPGTTKPIQCRERTLY